jgi:hypothetical protein
MALARSGRGQKHDVVESALPWRGRQTGSARFEEFCRKHVLVPKGHGAGKPLSLRPWQLTRLGLGQRRFLDPCGDSNRAPGRIVARWPGHMIHVDVKKVGRIPDGGGWRVHGRDSDQHRAADRAKTAERGLDLFVQQGAVVLARAGVSVTVGQPGVA